MMLKDFSIIGGGRSGGLQCDMPFNDRWLERVARLGLDVPDLGGAYQLTRHLHIRCLLADYARAFYYGIDRGNYNQREDA